MDAKATGALIAARRKQRSLSQAELAERLHVTDKAISRWETGRGMPGLDSLEPLSVVLGLSVSELLSGKELTMEELPKTAGGQIMESMKREHQWKWMAWFAMAAVTLLAIWGICISVQAQQEQAERDAHYAASVDGEDEEALAQRTAEYFQDWNPAPKFDNETLEVRDRAQRGNYLALLCGDKAGEWCMSVWQRDELFPERYCPIGGRVRVDPGVDGLLVWNFGDPENAIVVTSGVELPEEACYYEWSHDGVRIRGVIWWDNHWVLGLYPATFSDINNSIYPRPHLLDDHGNYIRN